MTRRAIGLTLLALELLVLVGCGGRGRGAAAQLPRPEDPMQLIALGAFVVVLLWAGLKILRG